MSKSRYDVIIIGAGVAGSSAAYQLAETQKVLLLEQYDFLHKQGSSHGGSRIFRHAYEDTRYVKLAVAADELWQQLEHDIDDKLLHRTGGLDIAKAASPVLQEIETALKNNGRQVDMLSAPEISERFPAFQVSSDSQALYQADAGILAATRCLAAMLRLAAARGADLHEHEAVTGLELSPDYVQIKTAKGSYEAAKLVITAGAWLASLLADFKLPLSVLQQQVLYVRVEKGQYHTPKYMPIFINREGSLEVYGFPLLDHPTAIKIAAHAGAPAIHLEERPTELLQERAAQTIAQAKTLLPYLTGDLVQHDLCLYTQTPDGHFILDTLPGYPNVVIGGGFSGHGFKFGTVIGDILRDLLNQGQSPHDLSLFKITRFGQELP